MSTTRLETLLKRYKSTYASFRLSSVTKFFADNFSGWFVTKLFPFQFFVIQMVKKMKVS